MKPLEGITVVEFSTMITASFAAMMLGEQGARVIKVEDLEAGDPMRWLGSSKGGIAALFANCNRGKQSVQINLKSEQGQALIRQLVAEADVVLCNFRPGVMDRLGLGSEALRAANPKLIYAAVSGFGTTGPMRDLPAYDPIIQAQAGFTTAQGSDAEPQFVRNLMCDKITAYTACQAVTAALFQRERTGAGQHIDLSMMDAGLFFLFPDGFMHHTLTDPDAEHLPPLSSLIYDLTITRDGALISSASTDAQRVGALMALDMVHLMADERFNSMDKLIQNLDEFKALCAERALEMGTDELLSRLREQDVPAAKCLSSEEVLNHPQYAAAGTISTVQHPAMGTMRIVKAPAQFGGQRLEPGAHCPALGEHTAAVLEELGCDQQQRTALAEAGVVPASPG